MRKDINTGRSRAPRGEVKSRRVQSLIYPSSHKRGLKWAEAHDTSFNEFINQAILEKLDRDGF